MDIALSAEQMKSCDVQAVGHLGIASAVLMERAAMAVFEEIKKICPKDKKIAVLCGSGNNGGDGLALARILADHRYEVGVYLCMPNSRYSPEFAIQLKIIEHYKLPVKHLVTDPELEDFESLLKDNFGLIVDAVFGVGLSRDLPVHLIKIVELVNRYRGPYQVVAVDVPTGLDSDTSVVHKAAIKADLTVALAFIKTGLILSGARDYVGRLVLAEIGINERSLTFKPDIFCNHSGYHYSLSDRSKASHKGSFGKLLILAGNEDMSGACYLAAKAAYRTGAGLVYVLTHSNHLNVIRSLLPECIVRAYDKEGVIDREAIDLMIASCDAALIGSGMGRGVLSDEVMEYAIFHCESPKVIDADGINFLAEINRERLSKIGGSYVITPHLKEYSRLLNIDVCEIQKNMLFYTRMFSREQKCISVVKSASTIVDNSKYSFINTLGNSGMATGGSGDVLAGMTAAALVQSTVRHKTIEYFDEDELWRLVCGVVELHSLAGDLAAESLTEHSLMAEDLIDFIPRAIKIQRGYDEKRDD